ncbi:MAG: hypothetical protein AAGK47_07160, partial [Bacteroidota bacterium]
MLRYLLIYILYLVASSDAILAQARSERIANYDIAVTLDTENKLLKGKEVLHWKKSSPCLRKHSSRDENVVIGWYHPTDF